MKVVASFEDIELVDKKAVVPAVQAELNELYQTLLEKCRSPRRRWLTSGPRALVGRGR